MRKAVFMVTLILLASTIVLSQAYRGKGKVKGYVFDEEGNPLEEVKVKLYSLKAQSGFETVTDADGRWNAYWIRGGTWNIDFEKIGYKPKKISAEIKEWSKNPDMEIKMEKIEGLVITEELKENLRRGNELFNEEKYEEAFESYKSIIEEFPDAYIIHKNIGNCYFQMEKYDLAEECYRKVLEKDSSNNEVMLLIGNTYANRGQDDDALEWYSKIEFEKIDDPIVLYNIGTNFYNISKFEEALKYYKRAVEIQDDFLDGLYQLGLAHLTLGNNQEAIDVFEDYLEHDPDSEKASQVRGFVEFLKKKIKDSK
ncbi:MAG: tetratricopeptide repeat protein [Candidatus Aminicenantes bacterium]|nr:MAG: tetratricopeptide repeat protein [Candidatus Aminicenantes bacterium]